MSKDYSEIPFEKIIEQNRRLRLIIKLIILALLLVIVGLFYFKKNVVFTDFYLKGDSTIIVNYGDKYKDEGFVAKLYKKDVSDQVKVKGKINYKKIGTYEITYKLKIDYLNIEKLLVRKVKVVDSVPPELTIDSDETVYIDENDVYVSPGYKAVDNYDGDLTSKVKVDGSVDVSKIGEYKQTYTISDSSKNETKKEVTVVVQEKFKNTYIRVSISNQQLEYYQHGKLALSSPVVTGYGGDTPYGTYSILHKTTNARLVAADESYDTRVNYWMAFIGNSHGFHDATWRRYFGGDIYTYDPSHGCVNMPYDQIEALYWMVEEGTPVYIVE